MAIPDNYIDKITKKGDSRPICPAADKVRVDNENFEGADLDAVLDEVAEAIEEAAEGGGYEPPQGGIPKQDLTQSVQDSLELADSSLQPSDKTQLQSAITSLQNALNTLIGSNNVQGVIDTFNEVKAFLDGIDTSDPTLANQLLALNNAISALQNTLSTKANSADVVPNTRTVNGKALSSNVAIGMSDIPGLVEAIANAGSDAVSVTTNQDGTFVIHVGETDYTINLNHTHENMARLIVCEESDLPSTMDNSTIYAITDSGETEIEKLIIRGMEFAGGGTPSTEPKIVSPIGTQIDFNGASTKTVTVRALNLSEALTIAVTGVTANLQTISANDAANGVQLTLTKGQNFATGTLRIYSSEVDKSWTVSDSQAAQLLTAVKLTGSQWLQTDYKPNANTKITMRLKFTANANTIAGDSLNKNFYFLACPDTSSTKRFMFYVWEVSAGVYNMVSVCPTTPPATLKVSGLLTDNSTFEAGLGTFSFTPNGGSKQSQNNTGQTEVMNDALEIGHYYRNNDNVDTIFNWFDLSIYELTISENNVTKRHYVPRKINGVPGLYDTETGAFISSKTSTELVEIPLT